MTTIISFEAFKRVSKSTVSPGDTFEVPNLGGGANFGLETQLPWVKIERGETYHGDKDTGALSGGAIIQVGGLSVKYGALCRLITPGGRDGGTCIQVHTQFFIQPDELLFWPTLIEQQKQEIDDRKAEVDRINNAS